jgi:hypothetical protein
VNLAEIETFRRRAREFFDRYQDSLAQLEQDHARQNGVPWDAVKGSGRDIALEAHARTYVLDPILGALGWSVSAPIRMVIEDGVNAAGDNADAHRRRLDYHGRDNAEGRSLVIVEAKRPNVALPQPEKGTIEGLFAQALVMIKAGAGGVPLSAAWQEILESAIDYAQRVTKVYGEAPSTFAITNGEWFVVFASVSATLLAPEPAIAKITVFHNLEDVAARADGFCELLSYLSLSRHVPPQSPEAMTNFIPEGHEAVCARVVDVSYGRHGDRQPVLSVRVGMWIRTPTGGWILFRKNYKDDFLQLSDERAILRKSRKKLNDRAQDLLATLAAQRTIRFASREEFEGSPPGRPSSSALPDCGSSLMQELDTDRYRLVTTNEVVYLTEDRTFDKCPYHDWGTCRNDGNAVGNAPLTEQRTDPRCFFPSGSSYHCAHATIGVRRDTVCLLLPSSNICAAGVVRF